MPQLVLPCTEEQALWAQRVEYLGLGLALERRLLVRCKGGTEACLDHPPATNYAHSYSHVVHAHAQESDDAETRVAAALGRLLDDEAMYRATAQQYDAVMAAEDEEEEGGGVGKAARLIDEYARARRTLVSKPAKAAQGM